MFPLPRWLLACAFFAVGRCEPRRHGSAVQGGGRAARRLRPADVLREGNAWRLAPDHFGGYPWEPETRKVLDANSPFLRVAAITTPLLIQHGDNDFAPACGRVRCSPRR